MVVDNQEAVSQDVNTSDDAPETSQAKPEDLLKSQVEKLNKERNDALSELGRLRKLNEGLIKSSQTIQQRAEAILKEQEERELQNAQDEPDKVAVVRERQARRQKEAELAKAQTELNEANARLQELSTRDSEANRERTTSEIASRLKVDPTRLSKLAKFTDGSAEAIEEIARDLPKVTPEKPRNNIRPDNNEAAGGTGKTKTQIMQEFNSGKINNVQYAETMRQHGWQP